MSAPRRWKDAPDAPIGVRELLASAPPRTALGDRAFARGAARVSGLGAAPAAVAVSTAIWVKVAAAGAVALAAAGVVALEVERREPDPRRSAVESAMTSPASSSHPVEAPPPVPIPEPPATVAEERPPAVVPPPALVAAPARAAPAAASPPASASLAPALAPPPAESPASPSNPSTLPDELALLDHAKKSLVRDPQATLRDVAAHRARYPHGALAPERDLLELDALRHAGRADEARRKAHVWLDRDPAGLHSARVRAILDALEAR